LGATVLIVTHDPAVAESCSRTIHIRDGRVVQDVRR
jgi:putative ABC transport system ATP-binding protein